MSRAASRPAGHRGALGVGIYVATSSLAYKLAPPPLPLNVGKSTPPARRPSAPGRPPELRVESKAPKTRGFFAPAGRARACTRSSTEHVSGAAERWRWALLAFPETPREFLRRTRPHRRRRSAPHELYAAHIERLGYRVGSFVVRDWPWERVLPCATLLSFVATMGLGFESANLEHTASFAKRFREAGDEEGARVQELVGREEIAHVRFGARWFAEFTGSVDFDAWHRSLPRRCSVAHARPSSRARRASCRRVPRRLSARS